LIQILIMWTVDTEIDPVPAGEWFLFYDCTSSLQVIPHVQRQQVSLYVDGSVPWRRTVDAIA